MFVDDTVDAEAEKMSDEFYALHTAVCNLCRKYQGRKGVTAELIMAMLNGMSHALVGICKNAHRQVVIDNKPPAK